MIDVNNMNGQVCLTERQKSIKRKTNKALMTEFLQKSEFVPETDKKKKYLQRISLFLFISCGV